MWSSEEEMLAPEYSLFSNTNGATEYSLFSNTNGATSALGHHQMVQRYYLHTTSTSKTRSSSAVPPPFSVSPQICQATATSPFNSLANCKPFFNIAGTNQTTSSPPAQLQARHGQDDTGPSSGQLDLFIHIFPMLHIKKANPQ